MTIETSNKNEPKVMLISSDGMEFVLPSSSASLSVLVCDALNIGEEADDNSDHGTSDVVDEQSMPRMDMLKVKGDCLQKVVDFLRHYEIEPAIEVPVPLPAESLEECVTQDWYLTFLLQLDRDETFDLLSAANYMNIKPLLDLIMLRITFYICGKQPEEIRNYLQLHEEEPSDENERRLETAE